VTFWQIQDLTPTAKIQDLTPMRRALHYVKPYRGRLLVIDFAQHDREELREKDAHLRLGFADDAIRGWFAAAGLDLDRTERLEGGELTVILWRGVKPGAARQERAAA